MTGDLLANPWASRQAFLDQFGAALGTPYTTYTAPKASRGAAGDFTIGDLTPYTYQTQVFGGDNGMMDSTATGYRSALLDQLFGQGGWSITPGGQSDGYNTPAASFRTRTMADPTSATGHPGSWVGSIDPSTGQLTGLQWINEDKSSGFLGNTWDKIGATLTSPIGGPLAVLAAPYVFGSAFGAAGAPSAADIAAAAGQPELGMVGQTAGVPITASQPSWVAGVGSTAGMTPGQIAGAESLAGAGAAAGAGSNWLSTAMRAAPLATLGMGGSPSVPNAPAGPDPQKALDEQIGKINALFAPDKRDPIYKQVYDNSYGLQSSRLNENREDTLKKLRFGLARTGLTGGSAQVDAQGLEQRSFGRALADASTAAQGQADEVRANDEKTRLNLIAQMRAGLDSADATQSALTQMADSANAARAQTRYDALDSYMGAVAPTINNFQVRSGQQAAQQLYNTRFPQNRISLSGRSGTIVG